jgi:hypothetical protein
MTTIINGKQVPDNMLSFFMGVLVVKYIIDNDRTEVHLADGRVFEKIGIDPFGKWIEITPLPEQIYKDFEPGLPFTDDSPVSEAEDKARMEAGG